MKDTATEKLLRILSDLQAHSNFHLAETLYPNVRIASYINVLRNEGYNIETIKDTEIKKKWWYRLNSLEKGIPR